MSILIRNKFQPIRAESSFHVIPQHSKAFLENIIGYRRSTLWTRNEGDPDDVDNEDG